MKIANVFIVFCLSFLIAVPLQAEGGPAGLSWKGWEVSTNEGWSLEYENSRPVFPLQYPLSNLFDGDARTTWVYDDKPSIGSGIPRFNGGKHRTLTLRSENPIMLDELWLMNGYNKRRDLFFRNDRVVQIEISFDDKPVKRARLSDQMGWHKITLPRGRVQFITLALSGIRKGQGPDNDICLSEMALFDRGRQINMEMPQATLYSLRSCCAGTSYLLNRRGQVLATGGFGEGMSVEWNPAGNLIAGVSGVSGDQNSEYLWIANARRARLQRRIRLKEGARGISWQNNQTVVISRYDSKLRRDHQKLIRVN